MAKRKSFMFYLSWEKQFELLDGDQSKRFVMNLIKYHSDRIDGLEFMNKEDELAWYGVVPGLEVNDIKWQRRADSSIANGRLGGRPSNSTDKKPKETYQVIKEPKEPDNSKELIDKSKLEIGNSKKEIDNSKSIIDNSSLLGKSESLNENSIIINEEKETISKIEVPLSIIKKTSSHGGISQAEYFRNKLVRLENELTAKTELGNSIMKFATSSGINELSYHLPNDQYQLVKPLLVDYVDSKIRLEG